MGYPQRGRYAVDPIQQNPDLDPRDLQGFLTRYTATPSNIAKEVYSAFPMGYYNSGFTAREIFSGIGKVVSTAGSLAAAVLPAIYLHRPEGAAAAEQQAPAAGPTAHPVLVATPKVAAPGGGMLQKIESVLDPAFLGGPSHAARMGRYATPGTKGYHMIKRGPHAGLWTRNRHRNVANIHALRRSLSRIHGFEKVVRKVIHFTHPKRAVGHAVFKRRKRR